MGILDLIRCTALPGAAVFVMAAWPSLAAPSRKVVAAERCPAVAGPDVVTAIGPGGEIGLASGRRVRVVDVRLPDDVPAGALGWLRSLAGSGVTIRAVGAPDRWGRVPARVSIAGVAPVDAAELLVGEGFAVVDAGERGTLCDPGLLAQEAGARARRLGIWSGAAGPIDAADAETLARRAGTFAVVEGRVVSVGERRERTYLNFGRDWSRDFSVVIPRKAWAAFKGSGATADALRGRRVRVRGVVEVGRAPSIEVTVPEMLEIDAREDGKR